MPFCPKCGNSVKEGDRFCSVCGQPLTATTSQPSPQPPGPQPTPPSAPTPTPSSTPQPQATEQRPAGITILAVLEVLSGLVFLGLGTLLMVIAGVVGAFGAIGPWDGRMFPALARGIIGVVGFAMLAIGILNFVIAYGYWKGREWAWIVGMIFAVLGLVIGLISLPGGIIRVVLDGLIIYYLTRPHVKRFFGKEPVTLTI